MVKYLKFLAKELNADEEVCEISAWLHDIIKLREGQREQHHVKGSEEAGEILKKFNYSDEKIQQVNTAS